MSRSRTMLGIIIALLWAPITSHCLFERLPGFEFLSCCAHEHGEASPAHEQKDCENDACAVVEEGLYKLQDNGDAVSKPAATAAFLFDASSLQTLKEFGGNVVRPAIPPPELTPSWQFSSRAAPIPRAPSVHL